MIVKLDDKPYYQYYKKSSFLVKEIFTPFKYRGYIVKQKYSRGDIIIFSDDKILVTFPAETYNKEMNKQLARDYIDDIKRGICNW